MCQMKRNLNVDQIHITDLLFLFNIKFDRSVADIFEISQMTVTIFEWNKKYRIF